MDKYDKTKLENQVCFSLHSLSREVIKLCKFLFDKYNLTYTIYSHGSNVRIRTNNITKFLIDSNGKLI